jgi:phosphatidylglycerol:prolipoprotein diacylglycerol transferase
MNTLAAYFHTLDPVVFPISGDLAVRWYGLSYVVGFVFCFFMLVNLGRRGLCLIPRERVIDAMLYIMLGTMLGGRLGYALIYNPEMLGPKFFSIHHGGMASHGGMIGCAVACWFISRWHAQEGSRLMPTITHRVPGLHVLDMLCLAGPVGLGLGRVANFVNGELLGAIVARPGEPGPWWSVRFPQELSGWVAPGKIDAATSHTPELTAAQQEQLFALVTRAVGGPITDTRVWKQGLNEVIRNAGEYREQLEPLLSARHPSQVYQAVAEGLLVGAVAWGVWWFMRLRDRMIHGVVSGCAFVAYGLLRVVTEFYRLPDPQFGASARIAGLSRGQWLSAAMVAVGVVLIIWAVRRSRARPDAAGLTSQSR